MGLFSNQFANVVEWEEYRDDLLFWKWTNREIKKDSRLIIKPGQDGATPAISSTRPSSVSATA